MAPTGALQVALDITPLIGHRTGVGEFCRGAIGGLSERDDVDVRGYAVSWRRRGWARDALPAGVGSDQRPMPARPLHWSWRHAALPPAEWFVGAVDVVHGTNFVVPPTRWAGRVMTVHDLTVLRFPELCDRPTLAYPDLIRRALRGGALVHTPSRFVADEVVDAFGVDPGRVRAVHSGIPQRPPVGRSDTGWPAVLPEGARRYVLSLATAEPRKDLPGLVAAFDELAVERDDLWLVLVGPPGWGEAPLRAALDRARHRSRIVRTGWVDDATVAGLLARAEVLAYPSRYEGFGFPALEAMARGIPVVASNAGALPEVLGDGAVLVRAGDPLALAEGLAGVLDSPAAAAALVEAGHRRARDFSWNACAAGLVALYRDAAAGAESAVISDESQAVLMVVEQLRRPVPGGIGTYTRGLLGGLAELDTVRAENGEPPPVSVTLYASRRSPDPLAQFGRPVTTVPLPSPLLTRAWDRRLIRAPRGFEVVHAVSLAAPAPSDRARLVVMVHDLAWRTYPMATTRRGRHWHERALSRAIRRAAALVVPSQTVAAELVSAGAPADEVRVIAEGADHLPPPDEAGAGAILRASGVVGPYLLAVSTLEPRKNLRRLLDAYRGARSRMPVPLPLVVAGAFGWGDPGLDGAEEGVVPVGHVEGATLAGLYAGAAALVYVPLAEGFGLPPLEAMALGVPVLSSTAVPSVADERDDPPALLVDPLDVEAIEDGLVRIVTDDDLVRQLAGRGPTFAGGRTWSAAAAAHVALWREL